MIQNYRKEMKVNNIKIMILALLFISGCSTEVRYNARKTGLIKVDSVAEIINYYSTSGINNNTILHSLDLYPNARINHIFRIGFPFSITKEKPIGEMSTYKKRIENISVGLCNNSANHSSYDAFGKNGSYVVYLSLDELQRKGLITNDIKNQKDICVYRNYSGSSHASMFESYKIKSNRIIFKKQEIIKAIKKNMLLINK